MILFPQAKINLGLNVLRKRADSYHEIETVMMPIPLTDVLEILPAKDFAFHQSGLEIEGTTSDNLVVRAYEVLKDAYKLPPVYIHLLKNIPMGAGLGGGSADATYTLIGLNKLFELGLSDDELRNYAAKLGSDCPFFVDDQPQLARGRGEILSPIHVDLKGFYIKLIHPELHIGTKEAYANVVPSTTLTSTSSAQRSQQHQSSIEEIIRQPITNWKNELKNAFETSAFQLHPEIKQIKESLYAEGAIYASMTGSGSAVYGIFKEEPKGSNSCYFERILRI